MNRKKVAIETFLGPTAKTFSYLVNSTTKHKAGRTYQVPKFKKPNTNEYNTLLIPLNISKFLNTWRIAILAYKVIVFFKIEKELTISIWHQIQSSLIQEGLL